MSLSVDILNDLLRKEDEDNFESQMKDWHKRSKELVQDAIKKGLPIVDYGGDGHCFDCEYASETIMEDPDDDFARHVCYADKCPYGLWKKNRNGVIQYEQ